MSTKQARITGPTLKVLGEFFMRDTGRLTGIKMKSPRVSLCFAVAVLVVCLRVSVPAFADELYSYTGNPFTSFSGTDSCSGGVGQSSISGLILLANPLAANLNFFSITPLEFSFTDGSTTITNLTVDPNGEIFEVSTGSNGAIDGWFITFNNAPIPPVYGFEYTGFCTSTLSSGGCYAESAGDYTNIGVEYVGGTPGIATNTDPGSWTATYVPEPSSLLLIVSGLAALGVTRRKLLR